MKKLSKTLTAVMALSVAAGLAGTASAQSGSSMAERIARLESAVQDLQGVVYSVEQSTYGSSGPQEIYDQYTAGTDVSGDMTVRIGQLERELQGLTGRIEEIAYRMEQNARRLDSLTAAISSGSSAGGAMPGMPLGDSPAGPGGLVDNGTGGNAGAAAGEPSGYSFNDQYEDMASGAGARSGPATLSGSGPLPNAGAAAAAPRCTTAVPADANGAYDQAFDYLLNGEYAESECSFTTFLEMYPDDPRAADAQFRLGEIYLATGANLDAAKAFLNHIRTWPNDARSPESYVKLGTAYARLEKREEACRIFNAAETKFPNASPSVRQRLAVERGAAGC